VFDAHRRDILECNPAFLGLAGTARDRSSELRVDDSLLIPGTGSIDDTLNALSADGRPIELDCQLRRPDGSSVEVGCSLSPTMYAGSQAVCGVIRDITERKRIDAELARARDAALESARL